MSTSYPFFSLTKCGVSYADILLFRECLIGLDTDGWMPRPEHIAVCERLEPDLQIQEFINAALCRERERQQGVIDGVG